MNGRGHFAGCSRHTPIGDKGHFLPPPLHDLQKWRQTVQLWHTVGFWPLEAYHQNDVFGQFSGFKGRLCLFLIMEYANRGLHNAVLFTDGRDFHDPSAKIAGQM